MKNKLSKILYRHIESLSITIILRLPFNQLIFKKAKIAIVSLESHIVGKTSFLTAH